MKLNIHIIFDELRDFSPNYLGSRDTEPTLEQVRYPILPDGELRCDCVYLMNANDVEKYSYTLSGIDVIGFGDVNTEKATMLGLSLIILPEKYDIQEIFDYVQDVFAKYNQWYSELIFNVASNRQLQKIADQATSILNNPIAVFDLSSALILKSGQLPENYEGTVWEPVLKNGYMPYEILPPDKQEILQPGYNTIWRDPTIFRDELFSEHENLVITLRFGEQMLAVIGSVDINSPFTKGQISLMRYVRDIMELAFARSIEFRSSIDDTIYYISNLMKGFPVEEKIIIYHLRSRGWDLNDDFRVYHIANPTGESLTDSQIEFCLYRIKKVNRDVIVFSYENAVNIIARRAKLDEMADFESSLMNLLSKQGLRCGRSLVFHRFSDLKYYYIQSKTAIYEGVQSESKDFMLDYGDFYISHVMRTLENSTSLRSICHPRVLLLREQDAISNMDYIKCLRVYIFCGCNVSQTAKMLYMHRNTLEYRIDKIFDILGIDVAVTGEQERLHLWLSCIICDYL